MIEPDDDTDPIDLLAEEVAARLRAGERPDPEEYARRHPELAATIRELFPALLLMERLGPVASATSPTAAGEPIAPPPTRLGEYRLLREVGRGGMGVVYEAVQEPLGRRVALKVLSPGLAADRRYRARFLREAKAAARLHHTHIVPVFASGEHEGSLFYAMQFIEGSSLAWAGGERESASLTTSGSPDPPAFADGSPLQRQPREVARLGLQAAEALAYAHAQGVLHRDVKPANLLLDGQGTLWVADFGLAKVTDSVDLTHSGELVGTLRYLAPERFNGGGDARADIYALGATLYELLAGRPAFDGEDAPQLMKQITTGAAPSLCRLAPAVPGDLETIVRKAMAAEPAQRYATAADLADDLRRFLEDVPVRARRVPAWERLRRWAHRNPAVAALATAVAVLLAVVAIGSTIAALRLTAALENSRRHLREATEARQETRDRLWESLVGQARALRRSRGPGQRFEALRLLDEAARIRVTPEVRNEVISCLALADLEEVACLKGLLAADGCGCDVDAASGRVAVADASGGVRVVRIADGREIACLDALGPLAYCGLALSPGGRYLAYRAAPAGRLRLWDLDGPRPRQTLDHAASDTHCTIAFSPDARRLAVDHPDTSVSLYDTSTGLQVRRFPFAYNNGYQCLTFHPRRPVLAVSRGALVSILDTETGRLLAERKAPDDITTLDWHPGGTRLAVGCQDLHLHLWELPELQPDTAPASAPLVLDGGPSAGLTAAFTPSGGMLASNSYDNRLHVWDAVTGQPLLSAPFRMPATLHDRPALLPERWGPDLRLWRLHAPGVLRQALHRTPKGPAGFERALIEPSGRWLFALTASGLVCVDLAAAGSDVRPGPAQVLDKRCVPLVVDSAGALILDELVRVVRRPTADPHNVVLDEQRRVVRRRLHLPQGSGELPRLGPAEVLAETPPPAAPADASADARVLVLPRRSVSLVVHTGQTGMDLPNEPQPAAPASGPAGGRPLELGQQYDVRHAAVSPDGRWAATGSHWGGQPQSGLMVWDATTGRRVAHLVSGSSPKVAFSPDGRWLAAVPASGFHCWEVGSWREGPSIEGGLFAFSPDGLLAVSHEGAVRLVDPASGKELARLEAPDEPEPAPLCFSPDGTLLAVAALQARTLHLWDLRQLRHELATCGLDWDRAPYPAAHDSDPGVPPRRSP